ncbi:diaminopropionate ammonia-lyase [Rhodocyclaceae bacterium SMB388]
MPHQRSVCRKCSRTASCDLDRCVEIRDNVFNFAPHRQPQHYAIITEPHIRPRIAMKLLSDHPLEHRHNAAARFDNPFGPRQDAVLGEADCAAARAEIATWPGYAVTPLHELSGLAAAAGLGRVWFKDEAGRFGLGSFKALGGAYAVSRILIAAIRERTGASANTADLLSARYGDIVSGVTVTCATDGNHGRSVAWGAQRFGCPCVIYIHATVSEGRKAAIERYGAAVVRTAGNYDDSVRQAAEDAAKFGRIVVSDTSCPGYMDIPRLVMQGYTVLADEAIEQLPADAMPTHVFLQGGVGGFAAAVMARFWQRFGAARPRFVIVEPDRAACILDSVAKGELTAVHGDLDTLMAGLACGEVSLLAWEILEPAADDALAIPDAAAVECMKLLAQGVGEDPRLVSGESGVTGLAGALVALQHPDAARALGLDANSRVLVISTEGATDPVLYRKLVGRSAEEVTA